MSYRCSVCLQFHHGELHRIFQWDKPDLILDSEAELTFDYESEDGPTMGRLSNQHHYMLCDLEVPIADWTEDPMSFVCWVEVSRDDYAQVLRFRQNDETAGDYGRWVSGRLANRVPQVTDTLDAPVKFKVIKGDPTPYIKWVVPGSALARLIEDGASNAFWHEIAHRVACRTG